jgi:hypothetical protein
MLPSQTDGSSQSRQAICFLETNSRLRAPTSRSDAGHTGEADSARRSRKTPCEPRAPSLSCLPCAANPVPLTAVSLLKTSHRRKPGKVPKFYQRRLILCTVTRAMPRRAEGPMFRNLNLAGREALQFRRNRLYCGGLRDVGFLQHPSGQRASFSTRPDLFS